MEQNLPHEGFCQGNLSTLNYRLSTFPHVSDGEFSFSLAMPLGLDAFE